jgi:hypothetical protein
MAETEDAVVDEVAAAPELPDAPREGEHMEEEVDAAQAAAERKGPSASRSARREERRRKRREEDSQKRAQLDNEGEVEDEEAALPVLAAPAPRRQPQEALWNPRGASLCTQYLSWGCDDGDDDE